MSTPENASSGLYKIRKPFFTPPLIKAAFLVLVTGGGGIIISSFLTNYPDLQKSLFTASTGLIFGGLLTAVVKLLVEDHKNQQAKKEDHAQFTENVLSDLKSVYDRVERARIVIPAHQSALTYGKEMRDLIDSRVKLRNVYRAIDTGTGKQKEEEHSQLLRAAVGEMESYLKELTDVFEEIYRETSKAQAVFEAKKKRIIEDKDFEGEKLIALKNEAWPQIANALHAQGFIQYSEAETVFTNNYKIQFEDPLDLASWILRYTLRQLTGHKKSGIPPAYNDIRNRLTGYTRFQDLSHKLANQYLELLKMIEGLDKDFLQKNHKPDKWSIHDNLAHLCRYQEIFRARLKEIVQKKDPEIKRYKAEDDPGFQKWRQKKPQILSEHYEETRIELIDFVAKLTPAQISRKGSHPKLGAMNINQWLHFFLLHESHHIYTIFWLVNEFKELKVSSA